jgi:hypothetical protein
LNKLKKSFFTCKPAFIDLDWGVFLFFPETLPPLKEKKKKIKKKNIKKK